MTYALLLLIYFLIFGDLSKNKTNAVDPLEGIVRDFAYAARTTIQQVFINSFNYR